MDNPYRYITNFRELYETANRTWRLLESEVYNSYEGQRVTLIAEYGATLYQIKEQFTKFYAVRDVAKIWHTIHLSYIPTEQEYVWRNRERGNTFFKRGLVYRDEIKRTHCQIEKITRGYRHCGRKHDKIMGHKVYISWLNVYVCRACADWLASRNKV